MRILSLGWGVQSFTIAAKAVDVDAAIRSRRLPGQLFLHRDRVPLDQVDLRTQEDRGQLAMWDEECFGVCGV